MTMMKMTSPIDKLLPSALSKRTSTTAPLLKSEIKTLSILHQESEILKTPLISQIINTLFKSIKLAPGTRATNSMDKEMAMVN